MAEDKIINNIDNAGQAPAGDSQAKMAEMAAFARDMARETKNLATVMSKDPAPTESTIKIKAVSERQEIAAATAVNAAKAKGAASGKKKPAEKPEAPEEQIDPEMAEKIRLVKLEEAKAEARIKRGKRKKKGVGFISSLLFIFAVLCGVYGVFVALILGKGHWFNYVWLIGAGILLIFSFLLSTHSRLPKFLKVLLFLALVACAANFGVFLYRDISFAATGPGDDAKWVIILGAKVEGNTPSVEFQARIDKAAAFVRNADFERRDPKTEVVPPLITFVTTGAQGVDEKMAEGEAAARILRSMGFDESRIITETKSTTTQENFKYAREIIAANGGTIYDGVVVVTSYFHLYRALRLAKEAGFENVSGLGSKGLDILLPHYYFREYAALMKEVYVTRFAK